MIIGDYCGREIAWIFDKWIYTDTGEPIDLVAVHPEEKESKK